MFDQGQHVALSGDAREKLVSSFEVWQCDMRQAFIFRTLRTGGSAASTKRCLHRSSVSVNKKCCTQRHTKSARRLGKQETEMVEYHGGYLRGFGRNKGVQQRI
jgi:hypothetical protein